MAINIDTNTDGDVTYQNPPVNRVLFPNITDHATPEEIQAAVDAWLEDHPEATTTVQDGSILPVKLDSSNDAADGYVLSWNNTAGKFEWVNVQADIDDLKQDFNNTPSNKLSVHLSGKRTHEGVVVTTDIGNVKNTFMVLPVQYDVFSLESGVNKLRLFALFTVPEEYLGRCLGAFYLKKYTSEPSEMLTNTTDGIQRGSSANVITNTVTGCLAVNISFTDADWSGGLIYRSLRVGIEIYTDTTRTTLERVIYSEQFTYKTNSMNPFSAELTNASSSDITNEGAIWGGYLAIPKTKYNNVFGISDFNYLSQIADSKTEAGSNPGVVSALVPYEENKSVVSVLRYGDIYSVSNAISLKPPSKTVSKAITSGDTFMLDGLWYKATTDLAVGDTLVVGTNCLAIDDPVISATCSGIQSATITTVWSGTQAQYDAIVNKDANTLYFIKET